METQKLQELIAVIEESNSALRHLIIELNMRKAMLPTLASEINTNEIKLDRAMRALSHLKKEVGLDP